MKPFNDSPANGQSQSRALHKSISLIETFKNVRQNLIFYSTGRFSTAQELKGAIPIALLIIIGLIFSVKVWFPVIGIL